MPRSKSDIPRTPVTVRLPTDLVARITLKLSDSRGRTKYGAMQRYFESLIRRDLSESPEATENGNS